MLSVRHEDGSWSNPAFITLTGGSFGWQTAQVVLDVPADATALSFGATLGAYSLMDSYGALELLAGGKLLWLLLSVAVASAAGLLSTITRSNCELGMMSNEKARTSVSMLGANTS